MKKKLFFSTNLNDILADPPSANSTTNTDTLPLSDTIVNLFSSVVMHVF